MLQITITLSKCYNLFFERCIFQKQFSIIEHIQKSINRLNEVKVLLWVFNGRLNNFKMLHYEIILAKTSVILVRMITVKWQLASGISHHSLLFKKWRDKLHKSRHHPRPTFFK